MANVALSVLAHPDDAEFLCAGTMIRLARECGWIVHIASMTAGDCGSMELTPPEIGAIRRAEGCAAVELIGGSYHCLEELDLRIFYNEAALAKVTRLLRQVRPDIVLTHSPADYLPDHEMTSLLARAACFAAPAPNFPTEDDENPLPRIPHLYYCDPLEGKDALGNAIPAGLHVDISGVIEEKSRMLAAHASQREWLRKHHGIDQYLESMREWARVRGTEAGVAHAEGLRQHRGHGYPQTDWLAELLNKQPKAGGSQGG